MPLLSRRPIPTYKHCNVIFGLCQFVCLSFLDRLSLSRARASLRFAAARSLYACACWYNARIRFSRDSLTRYSTGLSNVQDSFILPDTVSVKLYGTKEAAEYLGLSVPTIKYHVKQGNLTGQKVGHSLVFTRAELDRFKREKRPPHRPKKPD